MKLIRDHAGRILLTLAMLACAAVLGRHMWSFYMQEPWTRDGRICADIVQITPDVSGLVDDVMARDNRPVHKGDVLFRIDPERYTLALEQARAEVASTKASLAMAREDLARYTSLATNRVVSPQQRQEAETEQQRAVSAYNNALAALKLAELNLTRADVRASVNGMLTNFSLRPGNYAHSGQAVAALVDDDSYYVTGYFEETKLARIKPDAPVRIDIMGEDEPLFGHVDSIAGGIQDTDNSSSGLLAAVSPTFSWVRLAQRIPVRITIDDNPGDIRLIVGRTATVTVLPGKAHGPEDHLAQTSRKGGGGGDA